MFAGFQHVCWIGLTHLFDGLVQGDIGGDVVALMVVEVGGSCQWLW